MARNGFRRNYHTRCLKSGASEFVIEVVDSILECMIHICIKEIWYSEITSMVCYWYNINILHKFDTTNVFGNTKLCSNFTYNDNMPFHATEECCWLGLQWFESVSFCKLKCQAFHFSWLTVISLRNVYGLWIGSQRVERFPFAFSSCKTLTLK